MDTPQMPPVKKASSAFKAIAIEATIIVALTAIVVIVLNMLKIIDIQALFSHSAVSPLSSIKQNEKPTNPNGSAVGKQNKSPILNQQASGSALPPFAPILKNKALHYGLTIFEFEGKVRTVTLTFDEKNKSRITAVAIGLALGTDEEEILLKYPEEAVDKISVKDKSGAKLAISDLKANDNVTIKITIGIVRKYPNNYNDITITKN